MGLERRDAAFVAAARTDVPDLCAEVRRLLDRQETHLAMIRNLSQSTPLDDEVSQALAQRGVLLAEVGTLRARVAELEERLGEPLS